MTDESQELSSSKLPNEVVDQKFPVLAIDYGTKYIGLALATSPIVEPLTSIPQDDRALEYCGRLVDDYRIRTILVGVSQRQSAERAAQFAHLLRHTFGFKVKVITTDENFSTQEARNKLAESGKKIDKNHRIDHYAAAIFLENWLDEN